MKAALSACDPSGKTIATSLIRTVWGRRLTLTAAADRDEAAQLESLYHALRGGTGSGNVGIEDVLILRAGPRSAAENLALAVLRNPREGTPTAMLVDEVQAELVADDAGREFVSRNEILAAVIAYVDAKPLSAPRMWTAYNRLRKVLHRVTGSDVLGGAGTPDPCERCGGLGQVTIDYDRSMGPCPACQFGERVEREVG